MAKFVGKFAEILPEIKNLNVFLFKSAYFALCMYLGLITKRSR